MLCEHTSTWLINKSGLDAVPPFIITIYFYLVITEITSIKNSFIFIF
jgi:hypothetical protein